MPLKRSSSHRDAANKQDDPGNGSQKLDYHRSTEHRRRSRSRSRRRHQARITAAASICFSCVHNDSGSSSASSSSCSHHRRTTISNPAAANATPNPATLPPLSGMKRRSTANGEDSNHRHHSSKSEPCNHACTRARSSSRSRDCAPNLAPQTPAPHAAARPQQQQQQQQQQDKANEYRAELRRQRLARAIVRFDNPVPPPQQASNKPSSSEQPSSHSSPPSYRATVTGTTKESESENGSRGRSSTSMTMSGARDGGASLRGGGTKPQRSSLAPRGQLDDRNTNGCRDQKQNQQSPTAARDSGYYSEPRHSTDGHKRGGMTMPDSPRFISTARTNARDSTHDTDKSSNKSQAKETHTDKENSLNRVRDSSKNKQTEKENEKENARSRFRWPCFERSQSRAGPRTPAPSGRRHSFSLLGTTDGVPTQQTGSSGGVAPPVRPATAWEGQKLRIDTRVAKEVEKLEVQGGTRSRNNTGLDGGLQSTEAVFTPPNQANESDNMKFATAKIERLNKRVGMLEYELKERTGLADQLKEKHERQTLEIQGLREEKLLIVRELEHAREVEMELRKKLHIQREYRACEDKRASMFAKATENLEPLLQWLQQQRNTLPPEKSSKNVNENKVGTTQKDEAPDLHAAPHNSPKQDSESTRVSGSQNRHPAALKIGDWAEEQRGNETLIDTEPKLLNNLAACMLDNKRLRHELECSREANHSVKPACTAPDNRWLQFQHWSLPKSIPVNPGYVLGIAVISIVMLISVSGFMLTRCWFLLCGRM